MVGLVGDLAALAPRAGAAERQGGTGGGGRGAAHDSGRVPPGDHRRRRASRPRRVKVAAHLGRPAGLSPPGSPDGDGAADLLASASAAPLRAHRLDFGATPFDATPFDASAAAPALCQPAQTPATHVGALYTAASVGTAATAVATTPAYCGRAAMATPGVGGTPPSQSQRLADRGARARAGAGAGSVVAGLRRRQGRRRRQRRRRALLRRGARAWRRRPRPRPPATTGRAAAPAERPAAVAAGGRGPAGGLAGRNYTWSRRPAPPAAKPSSPPKTSVVDEDRAYALRLGMHRWQAAVGASLRDGGETIDEAAETAAVRFAQGRVLRRWRRLREHRQSQEYEELQARDCLRPPPLPPPPLPPPRDRPPPPRSATGGVRVARRSAAARRRRPLPPPLGPAAVGQLDDGPHLRRVAEVHPRGRA